MIQESYQPMNQPEPEDDKQRNISGWPVYKGRDIVSYVSNYIFAPVRRMVSPKQ
jgi:predicted transcriptional regulator